MQQKPNIVYILADDLGYGDLSCYGAQKIQTPNIDKLCREGMKFTDAHSSSAVCTPSRYSILTGRYCWRSRLKKGVLGGFSKSLIEKDKETVAFYLKTKGYSTACIGKWHLGLNWFKKDGTPFYDDGQGDNFDSWNCETGFDVDYTRGFADGPTTHGSDYFFGIAGSLDMPPYCFLENDRCVELPDREKHPYNPQQRKGLMSPDWQDDQCDITFAKKATEFIKDHCQKNTQEPFFLYLPTAAPHRPCVPPDFMKGKSLAGPRGDMVQMFDWVVGQVVETIEKLGITDNTLIIVTSDNGARLTCFDGNDYGHRSNANLRGQKADIWDGGHREPFIVKWPGKVPQGAVCDELICLSDLSATAAGIFNDECPDSAIDSTNILPTMFGGKIGPQKRKPVIHHSWNAYFSIRDGKWKLIKGLGSGGFTEPTHEESKPNSPQGQLYNLEEDIEEKNNLWMQESAIVNKMEKLLNDYISQS